MDPGFHLLLLSLLMVPAYIMASDTFSLIETIDTAKVVTINNHHEEKSSENSKFAPESKGTAYFDYSPSDLGKKPGLDYNYWDSVDNMTTNKTSNMIEPPDKVCYVNQKMLLAKLVTCPAPVQKYLGDSFETSRSGIVFRQYIYTRSGMVIVVKIYSNCNPSLMYLVLPFHPPGGAEVFHLESPARPGYSGPGGSLAGGTRD